MASFVTGHCVATAPPSPRDCSRRTQGAPRRHPDHISIALRRRSSASEKRGYSAATVAQAKERRRRPLLGGRLRQSHDHVELDACTGRRLVDAGGASRQPVANRHASSCAWHRLRESVRCSAFTSPGPPTSSRIDLIAFWHSWSVLDRMRMNVRDPGVDDCGRAATRSPRET